MGYWTATGALIFFGFVAGFSIGPPFLIVGVALLALGPFRRRTRIFRPALAVVLAFNLGYWLVVPSSCVASAGVGQGSTVACSALIGIDYRGTGDVDPPRDPALIVGIVAAAIAGAGALLLPRPRPSASSPTRLG